MRGWFSGMYKSNDIVKQPSFTSFERLCKKICFKQQKRRKLKYLCLCKGKIVSNESWF